MTYEDINLGSIWSLNSNRLEVVGVSIGLDRVISISYRYLSQYDRVCSMPVVDFLSSFNEEIPPHESTESTDSSELPEDKIYELSQYDPIYESVYYWVFKNNPTVLHRIVKELREIIRADYGYYEDDVNNNMKVLHNLKSVKDIEGLKTVIDKAGFKLQIKELL